MSTFVVHKKGFFYDDDSFIEAAGEKGSLVATFKTLEQAKAEKDEQDIISIQKFKEMFVGDLINPSSDFEIVFANLQEYYQTELGITISTYDEMYFPKEIKKEQAIAFLNILGISFHDIVAYADDETMNPADFAFTVEDLDEF